MLKRYKEQKFIIRCPFCDQSIEVFHSMPPGTVLSFICKTCQSTFHSYSELKIVITVFRRIADIFKQKEVVKDDTKKKS